MKIVVLGGSSAGTPALFRCLGASVTLPPLEFWLVGRCGEHLDSVRRASLILLGDAPVALRSSSFAAHDLAVALSGADLVLVQVRFGGYEGRHFDETFPLPLGICGDEGLGPGGLSAAWRAWPAMRSLLAEVESICPHALVLMLSSPLGIFVGAARRTFPSLRILGICELPWTTLQKLAALLEINIFEVEFDYIGLNHLGWFYSIEMGTRNLLTEYKDHPCSRSMWPSSELVAACGGFPTRYLRLHYDRQQVLAEQQQTQLSRAVALKSISLESYRTFQSGDKEAISAALDRRPTPWYDHAVVPFLEACAENSRRIPFFLTGCDQPSDAFEAEDLAETPAWFDRGRIQPKPRRKPVPDSIVEVLRLFVAYERQAICAVVSGDFDRLRQALNIHPWVPTPEIAAALVKQVTGQTPIAAA